MKMVHQTYPLKIKDMIKEKEEQSSPKTKKPKKNDNVNPKILITSVNVKIRQPKGRYTGLKKTSPICCLREVCFKFKGTNKLKVKG